MNKNPSSKISFIQQNFKKSFLASVELNKRLENAEQFICLASEPYIAFDKVGNLAKGTKAYSSDKSPRAAIIYDKSVCITGIPKLSNRDCAVAFSKINGNYVVIASIYNDINKEAVQEWFEELLAFVNTNNYPIIIGIDTNAHSTLYGCETNRRGEVLEEFIFKHNLEIANKVGTPTFHARRGDVNIESCIDVTLSRDLPDDVIDWRVDSKFNGSDHDTILFELQQEEREVEKRRSYKNADWDEFKLSLIHI